MDILSKDEEEQRKLILELVERIESHDWPIGPVPNFLVPSYHSILVDRIIDLLKMDGICKEVKKEVMARLKIQHCYVIACALPINPDNPSEAAKDVKKYLDSAFADPESSRYAIEGEDLDYLFNHIPKLKIADAFLELQKVWRDGIEISGQKVKLSDGNYTSDQIEEIYEKIEEGLNLNKKEAKKSLILAKRIAIATFEASVWNRRCRRVNDLSGLDPLCEAIWLEDYRTGRVLREHFIGPTITSDRIKCAGTSFLRVAKVEQKIEINGKEENKYLFLPQLEYHFKNLTTDPDHVKRLKMCYERMREEPLNVKNMDFLLISPGSYLRWMIKDLSGILTFKALLLRNSWKPRDINSDAVSDWILPSNAADPEQITRLRCELCLGIFWSVFSNRGEAMNNGWDGFSLQATFSNLRSFISENQLNWVKKTLMEYNLNLEHEAAIVGVLIEKTKRIIIT